MRHQAPEPTEPLPPEALQGRLLPWQHLRTDRSRSYAVAKRTEEDHVERIKEGLDRARAAGRRIGRPPTEWNLEQARTLRARGLSVKHIARQMGVSRSKVMRGLGCTARAMERPAVKEDAVEKCKVGGCLRPLSTAKPSAGYCYRHLREHAPDQMPASMRRKHRPKKVRANQVPSPQEGCCPSCGAPPLPAHQQGVFQLLIAEGVGMGVARRVVGKLEREKKG